MLPATTETSQRLRVLIVDDSRIVRATLVKHLDGVYEPREANDGIEAWETLLIDPSIHIVITDLTMPRLDGYGLLQRIRSSRIARIRTIPVVVISGAQEAGEQDRAMQAGATDMIEKGVTTSALLSRMDVLARLEVTQQAFERGLEARVRSAYGNSRIALSTVQTFETRAAEMLSAALENDKKFMLLTIRIGLQHVALTAYRAPAPDSVLDAIGQLLAWSVRQSDCVAQTGAEEFTLMTGSVPVAGMRGFAGRICGAIATAHEVEDAQMIFVACGGLVSLAELPESSGSDGVQMMASMRATAARRAVLGFERALSGVVGFDEEETLVSAGA